MCLQIVLIVPNVYYFKVIKNNNSFSSSLKMESHARDEKISCDHFTKKLKHICGMSWFVLPFKIKACRFESVRVRLPLCFYVSSDKKVLHNNPSESIDPHSKLRSFRLASAWCLPGLWDFSVYSGMRWGHVFLPVFGREDKLPPLSLPLINQSQ